MRLTLKTLLGVAAICCATQAALLVARSCADRPAALRGEILPCLPPQPETRRISICPTGFSVNR